MLIYILKSAACLAILLVFYKLFLEKENMHVFKRFYLLGSLLFALIVPNLVFTEYIEVEPAPIFEASPSAANVEAVPNIPAALEADVLDIAPLLWIVYFVGLLYFGIKFLRNLFQIYRRIRRNPKYKNSSFIQVLLQEKIPPHTFFKYIFLNKSKFESKEIPKEVILHEETHARQKHSLDVVFIELLQVIFWVNPLIYFFKKAIKLNHEFLADRAVINNDVDAVTYQNTLLSFLSSESAKKYQPTLPNAINYSSIKKRFTVMKSKTSKKSIVFRSFLLLPLLALLLAGFTETKMVPIEANKLSVLPLNPRTESPINSELMDFEILVSNTENGIKLNCNNGCAWTELDFTLEKGQLQLLDKFGMVSPLDHKFENEATSDNFLISVQKANREILMKGVEGTAWIDLGFTLEKNKIQKVTQFGVSSTSQNGATKAQLSKYNSLAKKYNAVPKTDRVIPLAELKTLELVFRKMTDTQKKEAQPFPECELNTKVIQIEIDKKGAIRSGGNSATLKSLPTLLKKYNPELSKEEREKSIRAIIKVAENTPKSIVGEVEQILIKYGVAQIDIEGPKTTSTTQDGATREQMGEYNKLAKHYNEMDSDRMRIRKKDVDRLEFIYGLMSEKQKADAEPFPDFPEPPPAPNAPGEIEEEMIELEREMVRQEKAMEEQEGAMLEQERTMKEKEHAMKEKEGAMQEQEVEMERQERIMKEQEVEMEKHSSQIPPPPTPPFAVPKPREKYSDNLLKAYDKFIEKGDDYGNASTAYMKNGKGNIKDLEQQYANVMKLYDRYVELAVKENLMQPQKIRAPRVKKGERSNILPPPPPPTPESPLDHVIEMAKKDATFYYEGEKISSDKAIEIIKNNNEINIHSTGSKSKKPVVKLSTKPIKLGSTHNIQEKTKPNLQKVELVQLQSNGEIEANKIGKRLKEFSKNYRNCTEYYFEGQTITKNEALHIYLDNPEIEISQDDSSIKGLVVKC